MQLGGFNMNKKIGIAILIMLLAGIVAIPLYIKHEQKSKEEIVEDIEVSLTALKADALSRIELKDESAFVLQKQDQKWIEPEYKELVYNDEAVTNMVNSIYSLKSKQVIHNVQDLSTYGINENSKIITLYDQTNDPYPLKFGHYSADKSSLYIGTDADKTIYVVNSEDAKTLFQKREELLEKKMVLPEIETLKTIQIAKKDEPTVQIKKNLKGKNEAYDTWTLEGYFKGTHAINTEDVDAIIHQIMNFEKDKFIGEKAVALEPYGLDHPSMSITLNNKWVIKFGKKEGNTLYFIYSGEPYMYTMSEEKIKALNEIKPIALIRKQVYVPDLSKLTQIEVIDPQQNLKLDIKKQTAKKDEGSYTSAVGEVSFDAAKTSEIISLIEDNVCIEAQLQNPEIEQKEERKAEISIVYHYNDHTTKTIELIPYDTNFYILRFEDAIEFAVGKEKVMSMLNALHEKIKANIK